MKLTYIKPPPKIEKITFTKEEQEDIDSILVGKPTVSAVKYWEKMGMDVEQRKKWFSPIQLKDRKRKVCIKYKIGVCHNCAELPTYKVLYSYDGVNLAEYYCNKCMPKEFDTK